MRRWSGLVRRPRLLLAALLALAASCARAPVSLQRTTSFPEASPAALAHLLADFSTHPHAAHSWSVVEERGNYTEWSYRVSFECGARCAGAASVRAAAGGALDHLPAHRHSVRAELQECWLAPGLGWPRACADTQLAWEVRATPAGGSELVEEARAWCATPRVLSGACSRDLREHVDRHLAALRARLLSGAQIYR